MRLELTAVVADTCELVEDRPPVTDAPKVLLLASPDDNVDAKAVGDDESPG